MKTKPPMSERVFTGCWHALLLWIHWREFRRLKGRPGRFAALGAVVWHADATVNDFRGTDAYLKRGLRVGVRTVQAIRHG